MAFRGMHRPITSPIAAAIQTDPLPTHAGVKYSRSVTAAAIGILVLLGLPPKHGSIIGAWAVHDAQPGRVIYRFKPDGTWTKSMKQAHGSVTAYGTYRLVDNQLAIKVSKTTLDAVPILRPYELDMTLIWLSPDKVRYGAPGHTAYLTRRSN